MAPKVIVPMDFGRHLLKSPTHNNLKLNTNEGGEVLASSVILSFNSPVIDHVTTTLHMTSVDLLEFAEAAVQLFVDCAYSGTAGGITLELFRDVNKIANVLEVAWLIGECSKYFNGVADSMKTANYSELLFLFEEAAFAFENLKMKEFLEVAMKQIEKFSWKQQFIENYLNNADRLSTKKLDLVIELAGQEVEFVVQKLTQQLSDLVLERGLPNYCRYLLDNSDLSLCKKSDDVLFDSLFSVLDTLPDNEMRWTYSLIKKWTKKAKEPALNIAAEIENTKSKYSTSNTFKISFAAPSAVKSLKPESHSINQFPIVFEQKLPCLDDLFKWLHESEEATNILVALEVVSLWVDYCVAVYNTEKFVDYYSSDSLKEYYGTYTLTQRLDHLRRCRGWPALPSALTGYKIKIFNYSDLDITFLCSPADGPDSYMIAPCTETYPLDGFSPNFEVFPMKCAFYFRHPFVTSCNLLGYCGFILDTRLTSSIKLCTEKGDYTNQEVHFHREVRSKDFITLFFTYRCSISGNNYIETWSESIVYEVGARQPVALYCPGSRTTQFSTGHY